MKQVTKNCLGFSIPVFIYESVEEADRAAGRVGAVLDEANNNLYYRGAAPEARNTVAEGVEAITGVVRATEPVFKEVKETIDGKETVVKKPVFTKDSNGNDVQSTTYTQDEADYVEFATAKWEASGKTREQLKTALLDWWNQRTVPGKDANGNDTAVPYRLEVDISQRVRKAPQPKSLPKKFLDVATKAIAQGKVPGVLSAYKKLNDGQAYTLSIDGAVRELSDADLGDPTKVGWLVKAYFELREAAELRKIIG